MSLARETQELAQILREEPSNHSKISKKLEKIPWVPATQADVAQLRVILTNLSTDLNFPSYLRLEVQRLLARWDRGVFDLVASISPARPTAAGHHGFISGDCWASRQELFNEGCHGALRSGIHGDEHYGAYSIVANGVYDNRDNGNSIWYKGTNPKDPGEATTYTKRLIRSFNTKNPVRVIRGAKSAGLTLEPYAPVKGFRYDGLYTVTKYEPPAPVHGVRPPEGTFEFNLVRMPDQPEIQNKGANMRPDNETLANWHNRSLHN